MSDDSRAIKISGTIASLLSLGMVLFGLTSQIVHNYLMRSAGISLFLASFAFAVYLAWTVYAFLKKDRYLLTCQGTGMVIALVLLVQTIYYSVVNR